MDEAPLHPCQRCGACCGYFRVSFYWREAEEAASGRAAPVPRELTEDRSAFERSMKGTSDKHHARCVALEGKIGKAAACSIYTLRPTPCREFAASFENGERKPRCDEARARYGLAPLTRRDWSVFAGGDPAATLRGHEESEISVP
jgi:Fe-S-cluster containining protein